MLRIDTDTLNLWVVACKRIEIWWFRWRLNFMSITWVLGFWFQIIFVFLCFRVSRRTSFLLTIWVLFSFEITHIRWFTKFLLNWNFLLFILSFFNNLLSLLLLLWAALLYLWCPRLLYLLWKHLKFFLVSRWLNFYKILIEIFMIFHLKLLWGFIVAGIWYETY